MMTKDGMRELIVATKNQGKLREIQQLLADMKMRVTSLADYPDAPHIVENGKTFMQNARIKAMTVAAYTGALVMGEDSGIEVKALDNAPGIYSARFAGPQATDEKNNAKLLTLLRGVPYERRGARYRCCISVCEPGRTVLEVGGSCSGIIACRRAGTNGFGYDPLFFLPRYQKTFGELDPSIKARISHRARALRKLKTLLAEYFLSRRG